MPKKYISSDYLYSKRDAFPFAYRVVFEKILNDAPSSDDKYDEGFQDGYETGRAEERGKCRV